MPETPGAGVIGIGDDQWFYRTDGPDGVEDGYVGPYPTEEIAGCAWEAANGAAEPPKVDAGQMAEWEILWRDPGEYWVEGYVEGTLRQIGPIHALKRVCGQSMARAGEAAYEAEGPTYRYTLVGPPTARRAVPEPGRWQGR